MLSEEEIICFQNNPVKIYGVRVDYKPEGYKDKLFKRIFVKKEEYEQEHEIRICLRPENAEQRCCNGLPFKLATPFITSVVLSQFLSVLEQKILFASLNENYPDLYVRKSLIVEK